MASCGSVTVLTVIRSFLRHHSLSVLVALPLLAAACGGGGQTSLAKLAANQDAYIGKQVSTSGLVEQQTNTGGARYYVLTDQAQNLVILQPNRAARPYAGRSVTVRGRFAFNPRAGRLIQIEQIAPQR